MALHTHTPHNTHIHIHTTHTTQHGADPFTTVPPQWWELYQHQEELRKHAAAVAAANGKAKATTPQYVWGINPRTGAKTCTWADASSSMPPPPPPRPRSPPPQSLVQLAKRDGRHHLAWELEVKRERVCVCV